MLFLQCLLLLVTCCMQEAQILWTSAGLDRSIWAPCHTSSSWSTAAQIYHAKLTGAKISGFWLTLGQVSSTTSLWRPLVHWNIWALLCISPYIRVSNCDLCIIYCMITIPQAICEKNRPKFFSFALQCYSTMSYLFILPFISFRCVFLIEKQWQYLTWFLLTPDLLPN